MLVHLDPIFVKFEGQVRCYRINVPLGRGRTLRGQRNPPRQKADLNLKQQQQMYCFCVEFVEKLK